MRMARHPLARVTALIALALLPLSSCNNGSSSDDDDDDDDVEETVVLPPSFDPLGRPVTGPIVVPVDALCSGD